MKNQYQRGWEQGHSFQRQIKVAGVSHCSLCEGGALGQAEAMEGSDHMSPVQLVYCPKLIFQGSCMKRTGKYLSEFQTVRRRT